MPSSAGRVQRMSVIRSVLARDGKHHSPYLHANDVRRLAHLQGSPIRIPVVNGRPHTETSITVRAPKFGENLAYDVEVQEDRRYLEARRRAQPRVDEPFAKGSLAARLFGKEGLSYWGGAYKVTEAATVYAMVSLTLVVASPAIATVVGPTLETASELGARLAAKGVGIYYATAAGTSGVALGRYPQYLQAAEEGKLNALNMSQRLFTWLESYNAGWTANQAFLDRAIATGQSFYLGSSCLGQQGTILQEELWYLESKGVGPGLWQIHTFIEPPIPLP